MSKKKNELNGVLVYRRWCVGAILSALLLLLVIAAPVVAVAFQWVAVTVPNGSTVYTSGKLVMNGIELLYPVLGRQTTLQPLINAIPRENYITTFFPLIYQYGLYVLMGWLGIIVLFAVIEAIFFLFYIFTGRVVSPGAPVKLAWVIFVLLAIYAGLTFGFLFILQMAYNKTAGSGAGLAIDFWWPVFYTGAAFIAALLLSIVYVAAFKDKFYIGRAKRFGSGESGEPNNRYETTHIITAGGTTTTSGGQQPQVIVVNSNPGSYPGAPYVAPVQGAQSPVVQVIGPQGPVQQPAPQAEQGDDLPVAPNGVLPSDLKSVGGHSFSKNLDLKYADIPEGIKELGIGAFANCLNLEVVSIPKSVKRIRKNCFFNCTKLGRINYAGTKSQWRYIVRGANWLDRAGTRTVVCADGAIIVDPHR